MTIKRRHILKKIEDSQHLENAGLHVLALLETLEDHFDSLLKFLTDEKVQVILYNVESLYVEIEKLKTKLNYILK